MWETVVTGSRVATSQPGRTGQLGFSGTSGGRNPLDGTNKVVYYIHGRLLGVRSLNCRHGRAAWRPALGEEGVDSPSCFSQQVRAWSRSDLQHGLKGSRAPLCLPSTGRTQYLVAWGGAHNPSSQLDCQACEASARQHRNSRSRFTVPSDLQVCTTFKAQAQTPLYIPTPHCCNYHKTKAGMVGTIKQHPAAH